MKRPPAALDEVDQKTLAALADLACTRRGFRRGRVRGWVPGPIMRETVGNAGTGWRLPRLRSLGLLSSEPASDPARPKNPIVLWRITQLGEDEVARARGTNSRRISRPKSDATDEHLIYLPRRAWNLLAILQSHSELVPWKSAEQQARSRFRVRIWHDDLALLLKRDFASREDRGRRGQPDTWVAATALGRRVQPRDVKASGVLVQLYVA